MAGGRFWKDLLNTEGGSWKPKIKFGQGRYSWKWGDYAGSDKAAEADIDSYSQFQKSFGLFKERLGEIGGEYDQREQFLEDSSRLEREGLIRNFNRSAMDLRRSGESAMGRTGLATSGASEYEMNLGLDRGAEDFKMQLKQNALDFARGRFDLSTQEKQDIFSTKASALDLYSNYLASRQNLKYDASGGFDPYEELGL